MFGGSCVYTPGGKCVNATCETHYPDRPGHGKVLLVARCPTPDAAAKRGAVAWSECVRCGEGVALERDEAPAVIEGAVHPLCMQCAEEMWDAGQFGQSNKIGHVSPFGIMVEDTD